MTRHLIRLMWNRKRQNLLLMIELFVAFLVVVGVAVTALHFGYNSTRPLGFSADDVWSLEVNRGPGNGPPADALEGERALFRQVVAELSALSAVHQVSGAFTGPYRWYSWLTSLALEGRAPVMVSANRVDDAFRDVLDLDMIDGRWFSREDDAAAGWLPVVINRRLALDLFGDERAAGRIIPEAVERDPAATDRSGREKRVVGVVDDFRQFGELSTPSSVLFYRSTLDDPAERLELPDVLLLEVTPGTTAAFEELVLRRLRSVAPTWSFTIHPTPALRESMLREQTVPLVVVSIVAGAMLLMVALGLTGVVWQSVTQRMREFGVRRAQGASGAAVGRQVIAELVVMTSFAVAAGCVLLLQIPLLPLPRELAIVPRGVFVAGVALATAAVYSVTILCAWYPSRLASRVPPAEALRYE